MNHNRVRRTANPRPQPPREFLLDSDHHWQNLSQIRRPVDVSAGRRYQAQIQHRQRSTRGSKRSAPVLDPGVATVNLILVGGLLILLPRAEPPAPIIDVFNNVYSHKFLVSTVSTISR